MRPIHKFLLPALIICLIFGTVPTAFADEPVDIAFIDENVAKAPLVECGDPIADGKLILPVTLVDYYKIDLLSGQRLKVDVDAQAIGSQLDYVLQLFDNSGKTLTDGDDNLGDEAAPFDPSLEYTATDTDVRPYIVAVSINILNPEEPPIVPDSYQITFECTEQGPVIQLEPGDLLASTGPSDGSLISIDRETGLTGFRGTLGNYGQVVDIEFRDDGVLFGATIDEIDQGETVVIIGTLITIDPNTGVETEIGTLESGHIASLEFGRDPDSDLVSLYGIHQASVGTTSQLGIINQVNSAFTVVGQTGHTDHGKVDGLAFESHTGIMYGVGPGPDGIELMTIDLATGVAETVGPTGLTSQILAIEFGPDGNLYGVTAPFKSDADDTLVTALVTIDPLSGTATEVVEVGGTAAEAAALAVASTSSMVSGLTFKPGWEPQPASTIITSLDDNPYVGRFIDKFKFDGVQGEFVTITVENLNQETSPEVIETTSKWSKKNFLVEGEFKGRAFLVLRDAMSDVDFRVREKGTMPLTIEAELPETGLYYLILMQPVFSSLRVDYSLTMTSSLDAFKTLEATRLIERRRSSLSFVNRNNSLQRFAVK